MKSSKFLIAHFFLFPLASILLPLPCIYAEDVRLSTYYPSPYGNYKQVQVQEASNATLTTYTRALTQAGIDIISNYAAGNFTPGIFWSTTGNFPLLPKAGIWTQLNAAGTGSLLYFGTSNTYNTGINAVAQLMVLDRDGNLGIGTNTPQAKIQATMDDAATAVITDILRLNHSSTGAVANGFGTGLLFTGESSTTDNQNMARIQSTWTTAANATRATNLQFQTLTNAGALTTQMTIDGAGNVGIGAAPNPNARLEVGGTTPILIPRFTADPAVANSVNGMVYYNNTAGNSRFRIFQNGAWTDMAAVGGGNSCTTTDTGNGGPNSFNTGYWVVNLAINGRNICEDMSGCSYRFWTVNEANQGGVHFYEKSPQMFRQATTTHQWHNSYSDGTGDNGDGVDKAIFSNWHGAYLSDDGAIETDAVNQLTLRDNTTSYAFVMQVCDT